jgi:hypothetical protein
MQQPQQPPQPGLDGQVSAAQAAASQPQYPGTGLDQQLRMLQEQYDYVRQAGRIGFDYEGQQAFATNQAGMAASQMLEQDGERRGSNLNQLATQLADRYGLPMPRGGLVDEQGNLLFTPDQIASMSGGAVTQGEAAAKMQYIENALTQEQNREQQELGRGAISAGMQLVADRGRGSLAMMQSGFYQDLADLYSNQMEEAEDYSYFIEQETQSIQMELQARAERLLRKQGKMAAAMGIATLVGGLATGNVGLITAGAGQTYAGGTGAGWW